MPTFTENLLGLIGQSAGKGQEYAEKQQDAQNKLRDLIVGKQLEDQNRKSELRDKVQAQMESLDQLKKENPNAMVGVDGAVIHPNLYGEFKQMAGEQGKLDAHWKQTVQPSVDALMQAQTAERDLASPDIGTAGRMSVLLPKMAGVGRILGVEIEKMVPSSTWAHMQAAANNLSNNPQDNPLSKDDQQYLGQAIAKLKAGSLQKFNADYAYHQSAASRLAPLMSQSGQLQGYLNDRAQQLKTGLGDYNTPLYAQPGFQAPGAGTSANPPKEGMISQLADKVSGGLKGLLSPSPQGNKASPLTPQVNAPIGQPGASQTIPQAPKRTVSPQEVQDYSQKHGIDPKDAASYLQSQGYSIGQ